MITKYASKEKTQYSPTPSYVTEYIGLSTDTKPMDAKNTDVFLEMDTGKVFLFDEEGARWIEQGN